MKAINKGSIFTEDLLSDEFFKRYSSVKSLEEFEGKFNTAPANGVTKEKYAQGIIRTYTEFKNIDEMKDKAIEFCAEEY
ncbi:MULTISPECIES: hypothetical protein [Psychrilyobacter]|uniref:hypothetical protein n=1 Tax=Psychrilyobacter TaxID=623282 RepID=UPI0011C03AAA|nr:MULTISPECIES: hypothetical protein [Psychrilyobacter]NDI79034.1 hypothetical protein [Psychrilyobacter piezotolerans]